jgi:hypothetical protein
MNTFSSALGNVTVTLPFATPTISEDFGLPAQASAHYEPPSYQEPIEMEADATIVLEGESFNTADASKNSMKRRRLDQKDDRRAECAKTYRSPKWSVPLDREKRKMPVQKYLNPTGYFLPRTNYVAVFGFGTSVQRDFNFDTCSNCGLKFFRVPSGRSLCSEDGGVRKPANDFNADIDGGSVHHFREIGWRNYLQRSVEAVSPPGAFQELWGP